MNKAQYNFTDPQSRIMPGPNGITQGYNAQAAVESRQAGVEESLSPVKLRTGCVQPDKRDRRKSFLKSRHHVS